MRSCHEPPRHETLSGARWDSDAELLQFFFFCPTRVRPVKWTGWGCTAHRIVVVKMFSHDRPHFRQEKGIFCLSSATVTNTQSVQQCVGSVSARVGRASGSLCASWRSTNDSAKVFELDIELWEISTNSGVLTSQSWSANSPPSHRRKRYLSRPIPSCLPCWLRRLMSGQGHLEKRKVAVAAAGMPLCCGGCCVVMVFSRVYCDKSC